MRSWPTSTRPGHVPHDANASWNVAVRSAPFPTNNRRACRTAANDPTGAGSAVPGILRHTRSELPSERQYRIDTATTTEHNPQEVNHVQFRFSCKSGRRHRTGGSSLRCVRRMVGAGPGMVPNLWHGPLTWVTSPTRTRKHVSARSEHGRTSQMEDRQQASDMYISWLAENRIFEVVMLKIGYEVGHISFPGHEIGRASCRERV